MSFLVRFEADEAYAEISLWDDDKTAVLTVVHSKFRRRGAGRKVLEKAIQYAEVMHYDLFLEVVPFGEGAQMPAPELKAFYRTLGFRPVEANVMIRECNKPIPDQPDIKKEQGIGYVEA